MVVIIRILLIILIHLCLLNQPVQAVFRNPAPGDMGKGDNVLYEKFYRVQKKEVTEEKKELMRKALKTRKAKKKMLKPFVYDESELHFKIKNTRKPQAVRSLTENKVKKVSAPQSSSHNKRHTYFQKIFFFFVLGLIAFFFIRRQQKS